MGKTYKNTPKGRSEIPIQPGAYNLRKRNGEVIYTGMTSNLKRRITEHHYDRKKRFSYITITETKTKQKAKKVESKRLRYSKPSKNR